ncbi:hypothetical protein ABEB36_010795 [Hypothenemus hampei]|uniref:SOCS box domain-containing protein n=1 Tax=Hypothenemus hampei TaxID=57062 RepID=A0ABD1ED60_HYPHA
MMLILGGHGNEDAASCLHADCKCYPNRAIQILWRLGIRARDWITLKPATYSTLVFRDLALLCNEKFVFSLPIVSPKRIFHKLVGCRRLVGPMKLLARRRKFSAFYLKILDDFSLAEIRNMCQMDVRVWLDQEYGKSGLHNSQLD